MTDEVKDNLPELLNHITTLKKSSCDEEKREYMCESEMKVINFDKIPKAYNRGKGWSILPKSNDALYIDVKGQWYFIEFKTAALIQVRYIRNYLIVLLCFWMRKLFQIYSLSGII